MIHQPKTLALLISLIGFGIAPAVCAKAALAVPEMTARDVVRWTPGLQWQTDNDDLVHDAATPALLDRVPVPTDVPAASPDSAGVEAKPAAASADTVDAATWSSFGIELETVQAPTTAAAEAAPAAPAARPSRLGALAQAAGGKLKAATSAGVAAIVRLSKPVPGAVAVEPPAESALDDIIETANTSHPTANAGARVSGACMAPPRAADSNAAHDSWLSSCLAQAMPEAWSGPEPQDIAARVAQRFPAAAPAPNEQRSASTPARPLRHSATLLGERHEIVVATHQDKVLHHLDAALKQAPGVIDLSARADDVIVHSQIEKVLQTLQQVSNAARAVKVRDKRAAHRANRHQRQAVSAAAVRVLAAEHALPPAHDSAVASMAPQGPMAAVDIDLNAAALPQLAAVSAPAEANPFGSARLAVGDASLDRVRGGFVTQGLNISFGIERAVYINGTLVTSTRLNVSELGGISATGSTPSLDAATLALIQSGTGNVVSSGTISPTAIGTVVQNTLDGQNIRNLTVIDATVNSLGVLRGLNLQSSLRGAVIDSLRR